MKIFLKNCHYRCFLFSLLLLLTECFSSCQKDEDIDWSNIDISNIENLYEQPLPVIKKCIQGKWRWTMITGRCTTMAQSIINTFVEISENNVVITSEGYNPVKIPNTTFSYSWKRVKIDVSLNPRHTITTYSLWPRKKGINAWWFFGIINDILIVEIYNPDGIYDTYRFERVK